MRLFLKYCSERKGCNITRNGSSPGYSIETITQSLVSTFPRILTTFNPTFPRNAIFRLHPFRSLQYAGRLGESICKVGRSWILVAVRVKSSGDVNCHQHQHQSTTSESPQVSLKPKPRGHTAPLEDYNPSSRLHTLLLLNSPSLSTSTKSRTQAARLFSS